MYHIREATIADVEAIRHIAHQTWWPAYSSILSPGQIRYMLNELYGTETLTRQISTGEQTFILLIENDITAGFAA